MIPLEPQIQNILNGSFMPLLNIHRPELQMSKRIHTLTQLIAVQLVYGGLLLILKNKQ